MLQDSSQNDTLSPERLIDLLDWLVKSPVEPEVERDSDPGYQPRDMEIPDTVLEILRCVFALLFVPESRNRDLEAINACLQMLVDNYSDVVEFCKVVQSKPSIVIGLLQKVGRPLPLPLKDLLLAMEELANDTSAQSADYRQAMIAYLELVRNHHQQFFLLMQDSVKSVADRTGSHDSAANMRSFFDQWVLEFESKFVQLAQKDAYAKQLGILFNAGTRVLKEQKRFRSQLTVSFREN